MIHSRITMLLRLCILLLVVEGVHAQQPGSPRAVHPILPYIFFDSAGAAVPGRYVLFSDAGSADAFSEALLRGDSLEIHYNALNIIASRMRRFPSTRITIVGCNSSQPEIGETIALSRRRGEALYEYFTRIWRIDTSRITLLPPRDYPSIRSNPRDPLGLVENRRAEIASDDWEIVRPVITANTSGDPALAGADVIDLIRFQFDSPALGTLNERIMREYLFPAICCGARVLVTGYTDLRDEGRGSRLSQDRARMVESFIRKNVPAGAYGSLEVRSLPTADGAPFSIAIPEGRYHDRGVRIVVRR